MRLHLCILSLLLTLCSSIHISILNATESEPEQNLSNKTETQQPQANLTQQNSTEEVPQKSDESSIIQRILNDDSSSEKKPNENQNQTLAQSNATESASNQIAV